MTGVQTCALPISAVLAFAPASIVLADGGAPAVLAPAPALVVLADGGAPAVLAFASASVVLADGVTGRARGRTGRQNAGNSPAHPTSLFSPPSAHGEPRHAGRSAS